MWAYGSYSQPVGRPDHTQSGKPAAGAPGSRSSPTAHSAISGSHIATPAPQHSSLQGRSIVQLSSSRFLQRFPRIEGNPTVGELKKLWAEAILSDEPVSIYLMKNIVQWVSQRPRLLGDKPQKTISDLSDSIAQKEILLIIENNHPEGLTDPRSLLNSIKDENLRDKMSQKINRVNTDSQQGRAMRQGAQSTLRVHTVAQRVLAPNHVNFVALRNQWAAAAQSTQVASINKMREILELFRENPQLLQGQMTTDGTPLTIRFLENEIRVKEGQGAAKSGRAPIQPAAIQPGVTSTVSSTQQVRAAIEQAALEAAPKAIRNPGANCFINASLVSLLSDERVYQYIDGALANIISSGDNSNPTMPEGTLPPLDANYQNWLVSTPPQRLETFKRMGVVDAAKCVKTLIEKWHSKMELNADESNLLRLCLLKLCNKKPNLRQPTLIPHINDSSIRISQSDSGDSKEFTADLLGGLSELARLIISPFGGVSARSFSINAANPQKGPEIGELRVLCPNVGEAGRNPVLNIPYISATPGTNFTLFRSLLEDEKGYQLDSIEVYQPTAPAHDGVASYRGHYVTYRKVEVSGEKVWLCYDDCRDPNRFVVPTKTVERILRGEDRNSTPSSFLFSDQNPAVEGAASGASLTIPIEKLKETCIELVQEGCFDTALEFLNLPDFSGREDSFKAEIRILADIGRGFFAPAMDKINDSEFESTTKAEFLAYLGLAALIKGDKNQALNILGQLILLGIPPNQQTQEYQNFVALAPDFEVNSDMIISGVSEPLRKSILIQLPLPSTAITSPDDQLEQRCKELIASGKLDVAEKVASRLQNIPKKIEMLNSILSTARDNLPLYSNVGALSAQLIREVMSKIEALGGSQPSRGSSSRAPGRQAQSSSEANPSQPQRSSASSLRGIVPAYTAESLRREIDGCNRLIDNGVLDQALVDVKRLDKHNQNILLCKIANLYTVYGYPDKAIEIGRAMPADLRIPEEVYQKNQVQVLALIAKKQFSIALNLVSSISDKLSPQYRNELCKEIVMAACVGGDLPTANGALKGIDVPDKEKFRSIVAMLATPSTSADRLAKVRNLVKIPTDNRLLNDVLEETVARDKCARWVKDGDVRSLERYIEHKPASFLLQICHLLIKAGLMITARSVMSKIPPDTRVSVLNVDRANIQLKLLLDQNKFAEAAKLVTDSSLNSTDKDRLLKAVLYMELARNDNSNAQKTFDLISDRSLQEDLIRSYPQLKLAPSAASPTLSEQQRAASGSAGQRPVTSTRANEGEGVVSLPLPSASRYPIEPPQGRQGQSSAAQKQAAPSSATIRAGSGAGNIQPTPAPSSRSMAPLTDIDFTRLYNDQELGEIWNAASQRNDPEAIKVMGHVLELLEMGGKSELNGKKFQFYVDNIQAKQIIVDLSTHQNPIGIIEARRKVMLIKDTGIRGNVIRYIASVQSQLPKRR